MFNWTPSCKKFHCFSLVLVAAFPARWCLCSLRLQKKLCRKSCKTTNAFSRYFVQVCHLITPVSVIWAKSVEKPPGVSQLFSAKTCLRLKAAKTPCCWKGCCQQHIETRTCLARGSKFEPRNLKIMSCGSQTEHHHH